MGIFYRKKNSMMYLMAFFIFNIYLLGVEQFSGQIRDAF